MHHAEFRDPRLVEVYEAESPWGPDDEFFLAVVGTTPVRVLDLGCGTGRLTLAMAGAGHTVTGVDPAAASLAAARAKPGADGVTWIEGTSSAVPTGAFDVVVMTSHVAQFLITDDAWHRTFADLHRALVPGGRVAFDTRDPRDRRWERWNPVDSRRRSVLVDGSVVEAWTEVTDVAQDVVSFTHHYVLPDGIELTSTASLRFRSEQSIRTSLDGAGFVVDHIYGGWHRDPIGHPDGELLVIARASECIQRAYRWQCGRMEDFGLVGGPGGG